VNESWTNLTGETNSSDYGAVSVSDKCASSSSSSSNAAVDNVDERAAKCVIDRSARLSPDERSFHVS